MFAVNAVTLKSELDSHMAPPTHHTRSGYQVLAIEKQIRQLVGKIQLCKLRSPVSQLPILLVFICS
jgi:hypothetical protein